MKRFQPDTLFLRLFVLMWATLILSHLVAYVWSVPMSSGGAGPSPRLSWSSLPVLPSLPPGTLLGSSDAGAGPRGPPPRPRPDGPPGPPPAGMPGDSGVAPALPARTLWLDYGLRALVIGLGALLGARWLASPMRRLSRAAALLAQGLGGGRQLPALDEARGTVEVRDTARAFNRMTQRLQEQFDQRSLHMAAISHDLRTPLTRLRLRIEQLPDAAAQAAIADIREMDDMIDVSLAVMREQASGAEPSVVDLGALLQALVDDLGEQGRMATLDEMPTVRVRARPAALRRIVGNLVGNALSYGVRASLSVEQTPAGVLVHVDDEGPGIPPGQLEQAFKPWVRLPSGQTLDGHGLGLSIARDLTEREGGTLTLCNRPRGGLRASLCLRTA